MEPLPAQVPSTIGVIRESLVRAGVEYAEHLGELRRVARKARDREFIQVLELRVARDLVPPHAVRGVRTLGEVHIRKLVEPVEQHLESKIYVLDRFRLVRGLRARGHGEKLYDYQCDKCLSHINIPLSRRFINYAPATSYIKTNLSLLVQRVYQSGEFIEIAGRAQKNRWNEYLAALSLKKSAGTSEYCPRLTRFLGVIDQVYDLLAAVHKRIVYRIPYQYIEQREDEPCRDVPVVPDFLLSAVLE